MVDTSSTWDPALLYSLMSRVLTFAFAVLNLAPSLRSDKGKAVYDKNYRGWKLTVANLSELPEKGHFFAYFDGLLLPDQGSTITTFLNLFSRLCGSKPAGLAQTLKVCGSGWSTLSNTVAGREYSHMLFCISQAISSGVRMRPVFLNDRYAGCVVYSSTALVHVGSIIHVPIDQATIKDAISSLRSHDTLLAEICGILSDITTDDGKDVTVDPTTITSSRHLHNEFRIRPLGPDTISKIQPILRKISFEQALWDVTNPDHVRRAVAMIVKKEFPDTSVPCNLRIDAVFTKKPIYSVLAAFGTRAPSLRGTGSQVVRRISPGFYTTLDKPGKLTGIPVFAKSHNEAKEDWEGILSDYTIFFDSKGKDKEGRIRVRGVTSFITFDSDAGKAVMNSLSELVKDSKKRKEREDEPVGMTEEELARRAKAQRRREKGYGMLGLTFELPQGEAMEEDDDDIYA